MEQTPELLVAAMAAELEARGVLLGLAAVLELWPSLPAATRRRLIAIATGEEER